jgi:hypothetical protein
MFDAAHAGRPALVSDTPRVDPARKEDEMATVVRWMAVALAAVAVALAALWRAVANVAEMLSDAGHGPNPPREEAGRDNAYAGEGRFEPLRDWEDRAPLD